MTDLKNEEIEEAFARIRAEFEKRKNETGIEILDSYEEQWAATGSLSDRQQSWLERQLDGTWKAVGPNRRTTAATKHGPPHEDEADLLDAMIEERLAAKGKRLVDAAQIGRLRQAVNDLDAALGGLDD